jgi:uncharacterized protein with PQ loop repeat
MSTYCELSRVIQLLSNVALTFGLFAQCGHLFRTKTVKGITPLLVVSLAVTQLVRLNYGVAIKEWPIIAAGVINVVPVALIAIGYWRYRRAVVETA